MYCVIGEEILKCEIKRKDEFSSLCKVGSSPKEQLIANSHLFDTEAQAIYFVNAHKEDNRSDILYSETETPPHTHIAELRQVLNTKTGASDKNPSRSFHPSSEPKTKTPHLEHQKKFSPQKSFGFKGK